MMERNQITVTYGSDPGLMTRQLLEALRPETEIPKGRTVLLKPNLVVAKGASTGATTHPEILEAIILYLREQGIQDIVIAEGSWIGDNTKRAFQVSGIGEVARRMKVPCLDLKDDDYETVTSAGIKMEISKTALEAGYLISLPVLKGHCQTTITCALKNMKGILSDRSKRMFHSLGLHRPIAALNAARCADLVIVDSLCGDLDFEEGGNPVSTNRMLAGKDSVLLDAYGAALLGYETGDIPYIGMAEQLGVGTADLDKASIVALNQSSCEKAPVSSRRIRRLEGYVQADSACSACYGNLIHALSRLEERGDLSRLRTPVLIGQGFRGQEKEGLGIGNCCRGCSRYVKGCPPSAIDIVRALEDELS